MGNDELKKALKLMQQQGDIQVIDTESDESPVQEKPSQSDNNYSKLRDYIRNMNTTLKPVENYQLPVEEKVSTVYAGVQPEEPTDAQLRNISIKKAVDDPNANARPTLQQLLRMSGK